jgi:hypothetical protein
VHEEELYALRASKKLVRRAPRSDTSGIMRQLFQRLVLRVLFLPRVRFFTHQEESEPQRTQVPQTEHAAPPSDRPNPMPALP